MDSVYKAYRWVEETIVFRPTMDPWQSAVAKALLEVGVGPDNGLNLDHIKGTKIGTTMGDDMELWSCLFREIRTNCELQLEQY